MVLMKKITVIGFGSWGTALAALLSRNGHEVTLWSKFPTGGSRVCPFFKGFILPDDIKLTENAEEAADADVYVLAVPSVAVREAVETFLPYYRQGQLIVNGGKGFEEYTLKRLSEVIAEAAPMCSVGVLTGPTHAEELLAGIPSAAVAAGCSAESAMCVQDIFMNSAFRVYVNDDLTGVEIGGALKNVIALAAGCSDGLGYGDNTKAALMTRGIAEIARLGMAMGAKGETFMGLAGIGDLIVTCTSMHSRNRRAGILIGQGKSLETALKEVQMVVEGVVTAKAAYGLAKRYNVEMPISTEMYRILFEGKAVAVAVDDLMGRGKTAEK
jgi:glycerol-3-phosphate dehydrogenase (NAD(P)+)